MPLFPAYDGLTLWGGKLPDVEDILGGDISSAKSETLVLAFVTGHCFELFS